MENRYNETTPIDFGGAVIFWPFDPAKNAI